MRLWMRDKIMDIDDLLANLQRSFVEQAQKQGQIVMPGYTHLQRAQPILSGNYLLAFVEQFQRDRDRLQDAQKLPIDGSRMRKNVKECPRML